MGRNAKRKKEKKFQLPSFGIRPVGDYVCHKEVELAEGWIVCIDVVKSHRSGRWLVCLDPNPSDEYSSPVTLTVWDSLERAMCGGNEVVKLVKNYTLAQLKNTTVFQEFLRKLSQDDDQIIAVCRKGKIHTDEEITRSAMKMANHRLIEEGSQVRFRVDGETVL
ncbi:hypothetical protein [Microcoleus sp. Pol17_C1]|uniref:hypothetical protein n=1 Tax=unclassified Microcoleus TaxID=2642155 RepID=UPI002FCFE27C